MKILHLSDTTLSGGPIRIVDILNKYSDHTAQHIVWRPVVQGWRRFKLDVVGSDETFEKLEAQFKAADVFHFHNRWRRQEIFQKHPRLWDYVRGMPAVIQMHSPRVSEDFTEEAASGVPLAVIAQYHVRLWPEANYILPNCVDLNAPEYNRELPPLRTHPVVSFAPSNSNGKGLDDKGTMHVVPMLKRMAMLDRMIQMQMIAGQPHDVAMEMKRNADIGIDEVMTGSYHLSGLEYAALGIPCFANIDAQTAKAVCDLTGADVVPFLIANKDNLKTKLEQVVRDRSWQDLGAQTKAWMAKYWAPGWLASEYSKMYEDLA